MTTTTFSIQLLENIPRTLKLLFCINFMFKKPCLNFVCNINFWIENDPLPPLALFRKFTWIGRRTGPFPKNEIIFDSLFTSQITHKLGRKIKFWSLSVKYFTLFMVRITAVSPWILQSPTLKWWGWWASQIGLAEEWGLQKLWLRREWCARMKGLRFDEVKLPEKVVGLEVYMKVDLDREVRWR